jgi:hypothetical protein
MMFDMKLQKMVGLLIIKSSIKILLRLPIRCLRQPQMWISGFKIDLTADRSYSKNFRNNIMFWMGSIIRFPILMVFFISTVLIKHRSPQVMKFLLQHLMTLELTGL